MAKRKSISPPSKSVSYCPSSKGTMTKNKCASGDYYGTGVKNPVGKIRYSYMDSSAKPNQLKKPPKALA